MIEVLFGESEAGAMKAAKNTTITGKVDGPTSVWIAGKKKPPERENCGWIEGTAEDVICLGFLLDIGNIKENISSEYRKHLIYSMYVQEQWGKDEKIIWKRLTYKPIKEARLIGDILGYYQLDIGDTWYAKRIDYFIQIGKIRIIEDSENSYARTICLT